MNNAANQDTEKVFQTVSVARVPNRERNVSGKLISEILRAYILLSVCVNVSEILLLSINSNMTYQNKKARSARTRCSTCKFRAQIRRQSHKLGCASNKCLVASASSELATELPLRFEPNLLSVLKLYTGGN